MGAGWARDKTWELPLDDAARRRHTLLLYLRPLSGSEPPGSLLELRYRRPGGTMRQRFYRVADAVDLARAVLALSARAEVYVGCAPRRHASGRKEAIARVWVLWADCDGPAASSALADFLPAPALLVRSGTGGNRHAYWPLAQPLLPAAAERANRRLAYALGADMAATDASRILRPPGSRNHKHRPSTPVALERCQPQQAFTAYQVVGSLADPPQRALLADPPQRALQAVALPAPLRNDDPLRAITPEHYVAALTGLTVGRGRKVACPLHQEHTPSLHVYPAPEQGWYCFGCGRGGSVYDLAAALWKLEPRGSGFLELRRRLSQLLLPGT